MPQSASGWLIPAALATHQTATPEMYGVDLGAHRRVGHRSHQLPLRRLGPDAGRGVRFLLEGAWSTGSGSADLDTVLAEIDESWPR